MRYLEDRKLLARRNIKKITVNPVPADKFVVIHSSGCAEIVAFLVHRTRDHDIQVLNNAFQGKVADVGGRVRNIADGAVQNLKK